MGMGRCHQPWPWSRQGSWFWTIWEQWDKYDIIFISLLRIKTSWGKLSPFETGADNLLKAHYQGWDLYLIVKSNSVINHYMDWSFICSNELTLLFIVDSFWGPGHYSEEQLDDKLSFHFSPGFETNQLKVAFIICIAMY